MSIVHALFVPKGAVTKSGFMVAALVLIALGAVSDGLGVFVPMLGPFLFFLGLVITYCWVALWIKRFHAAGTSGWWTVLVVLGWIVIESVVAFSILMGAGLDLETLASGDNAAIQAVMTEVVQDAAVPSLIGSVLVSLVVALGLNAVLPAGREANRDGGDDQSPPSEAPES